MTGPGDQPAALWAPWALPITSPPVRDALLEVAPDGSILRVAGGFSRAEASARGAEVFDGCVLAPGFVNAHSHIEYAPYDALADALPFADWIGDHIRRKRRLSPEQMRAGAELGAWQSVAGGITCTADASYSGDAAHAMAAAGMRGRVYLEVFGTTDEEAALERTLERIAQLPDGAGRIEHGISPHAPYTVSERLYRLVASTGLPWTTHLLESRDEVQLVRNGTGPLAAAMRRAGAGLPVWGTSPVQRLADVLGPHTLGVHLVHASGADLEVLAAAGAPVAHCPRSNARLGCGVLDLDAFDRAGVVTALGTDSPSSAGPLDMFAEMRTMLEVQRAVRGDATSPDARRALELATVDAATAIGMPQVGLLEAGARADVVALRTGPVSDPTVAYVLGGTPSAVAAVFVDGRSVWRTDRTELARAEGRAAEARALLALPVKVGDGSEAQDGRAGASTGSER